MSEAIAVKDRQTVGKLNNRRLRAAGEFPAILYGHGAENVNLAIPTDAFLATLRHGSKMIDLTGAVSESAMISEVQWDVFGKVILHADLIRVSKDERVEVSIALETRGVAPGVSEGGTVEVLFHELAVECSAGNIPEKLELNVNELGLNGTVTADAIELPAGVKLVTDAGTIVAQCLEVSEADEEEAGGAATAEPEIIGRAAGDEETSDGK